MTSIVWFRQDLRLEDNPALAEAVKTGGAVIPVFIWAPEEEGAWPPGAASRWWLHQSLESLAADLNKRGSRLIILKGRSLRVLEGLVKESGAEAVFWNRRYEPAVIKRDAEIKTCFKEKGVRAESFNSALLYEPWQVQTGSKTPYQVYTAFWNATQAKPSPDAPAAAPSRISAPARWPGSLPLEKLGLEPKIKWAGGMRAAWNPGSGGAQKELKRFISEAAASYEDGRNIPSIAGTSRLSPHLHFGEISIRRVWKEIGSARAGKSGGIYLKELVWREFAHHLLFHFPGTPEKPLKKYFEKFTWKKNSAALKAWQKGMTGYPIVDAGMRELWVTGWMHNRVRMIAASFLVKDLLLPWQEGAKWFWDTLVDADLASNTMGWQWTAGCGADAAPFFRIFNPVSQGERFDPHGQYVRKWVPEIAGLPDKWIHQPFAAPLEVLRAAGVTLGKNYPGPVADHASARKEALMLFERAREKAGKP